MGRAILLLVLGILGSPMAATAQFWDFVYRVLNGDTASWPDYDTTYIESYRDDLALSAVTSYQGSSIAVKRKDGDALTYTTNTTLQYGIGLDYKWLGIEASFSIPGLGTLDPDRGTTKIKSLGFGYTGRSWWFRNYFRNGEGYSPNNPTRVDPDWSDGDPYPYRDDIRNFTYVASLNHGFNAERFSYNAAIWQMERQKRSAGSLIAGATFWYSETNWDEPLIPAYDAAAYEATTEDLNAARTWVFSLTGGYSYTVVIGKHGFINALAVPGLGFRQVRMDLVQGGDTGTGWEVAGTAEFRLGMGYIGDRWYAAITGNSYRSIGPIPPDVFLAQDLFNMRGAIGWRFKNAGPFIPRIGL